MKNHMCNWSAVIGMVFLVACSTSTSVQNDVAAAEEALTTAENLALIYTTLPRCGGIATLCSSQSTVDKIKALDQQAYTAVKAAQQNSALVSAAWIAISNFQLSIPKSGS